MIQVWAYDENKVFTESCFVDEIIDNMTIVPLLIGYVKPTFNEQSEEWFEGATQEEIKEWEDANKVEPQPSTDDKIIVLESEIERLLQENEQLKQQHIENQSRIDATENAVLELMTKATV